MRRTAYSTTAVAMRALFAAVTTGSLVVGSIAVAGSVSAEPAANSANPANVVAALVDKIAQADQKIADLRGTVASKRQSVNQAIVDLQSAQNAASAAAGAVKISDSTVAKSDAKIKTAQDAFDRVVRAAYEQGNTGGALINTLGGNDPGQVADRATALQIVAEKQRAALGDLKAAKSRAEASRTAARAAKVQADAAAASATDRKQSAEQSITDTYVELKSQEAKQNELAAQRELAQRALDQAKQAEDRAAQQKIYAQYVVDEQQTQQVAAAAPAAAPATGSVDAADPLAAARGFAQNLVNQAASFFGGGATAPAAQAAAAPAQAAAAAGAAPAQSATGMTGAQMIEKVVERAMSVIGVQYAWGGGNAYGATKGVRDGGVADSFGDYNRIGFDCSGLMAYAYAAVGIALPKYSGYQFTTGNKVPVSQLKRGDMVFRGPGGTQHVAMYLGNNQILEAPQSGGAVRIAPFDASTFLSEAVRVINS